MLIPDNSFKNIIFQELEKGDKSISSLHRVLVNEGHKVHRLVLTGYLKAMEETGMLSSRDFPPSKVYSISSSTDKDIYESLKEVCANTDYVPEKKKPEVILYFLQKLFRRPVFQEEMLRAGFEGDIEAFSVKVSNEERLEIKKQLSKKGYKLPLKDQAFVIQDRTYDREFELIIQQMLLHKFKSAGLSVDTKQTKLGF